MTKAYAIRITLLATVALGSVVFAGTGRGAPLEYAPAPADNPLRGLVPYVATPGRGQFPHSMEFRYFALKDLMKGPAVFDWDEMERTLEEVNGRGNQLIYRVHCEYPGKASATPLFLVEDGVKMTRWTNEGDGQVSETPDYENPLMRGALVSFIEAMGSRYDGDPRIAFITAGLLGSWGEWHTYPRVDLWASKEVQREIMEAYAKAFSTTKILLRYPAGPTTWGLAENAERPFGYHDDSFAWATLDTGKEGDSWFFEPSLKAAGASEKWMQFPIGGEIRPELWEKSFTTDRHRKDQGFVACVERLHASWLLDSGLFDSDVPLEVERKKAALRETARMGYELHVAGAEWNDGTLSLTVENRGVAPFYYDWPVEVEVDGKRVTTDWKLRGILPDEPGNWSIELPEEAVVRIRIPNPMTGGKPLRFANREQGKVWLTAR